MQHRTWKEPVNIEKNPSSDYQSTIRTRHLFQYVWLQKSQSICDGLHIRTVKHKVDVKLWREPDSLQFQGCSRGEQSCQGGDFKGRWGLYRSNGRKKHSCMEKEKRTERKWMWYKAAAPELAALLPRQVNTLYCIAEEKDSVVVEGGLVKHTISHTHKHTHKYIHKLSKASLTSLLVDQQSLLSCWIIESGRMFFFKTPPLNKKLFVQFLHWSDASTLNWSIH